MKDHTSDPCNGLDLLPYELIYNVGEIFRTGKVIFGQANQNHAYRYVKLVENSTAGHDCKYAKATQVLWEESGQKHLTLNLLVKLKEAINEVLEINHALESTKEEKK